MQASKFGRTDCADYDGFLRGFPNGQLAGEAPGIHQFSRKLLHALENADGICSVNSRLPNPQSLTNTISVFEDVPFVG